MTDERPIQPASEQATLQPEPVAPPAWMPPPPPAPRAESWWHRLAATLVLVAVVAASAGAGIGWSLARAIEARAPSAAVATPSEAPIRSLPGGSPSSSLNASAVAAKVSPAIVNINTTLAGGGTAAGTGQIVTASGEILTNDHVVRGSTSITVSIQGRTQTYPATLIAVNQAEDVALIKIDGVSGLPTVKFADSSSLKVGDTVFAIGNKLGQGARVVNQGSVTALDQTVTASEGRSSSETLTGMIESDAVIYPGDSGGALVNASGQVVGMITAGQATYRSAGSEVGYAIASNTALKVVNRIRAGEQASDLIYGQIGYIGVSTQTLTAADAARLGFTVSSGVLIVGVQPGSAAEAGGITPGSAITSVGGTAVTSTTTLGTAVKMHKPGEKVSVTFVNKTGTHTVTVTLGAINP